ncbi:MAG TPA: hypothetical protein VJC14_01110 [Candidatus Paceibacterota bacterium]
MKTSRAVVIILLIAVVSVSIYAWSRKNIEVADVTPAPVGESDIKGCYVAGNSKDVYTLNIKSQIGGAVAGTLAFKNFEKDSSSGTYVATYDDGILLGNYSFQSEGMNSVMQVVFKKSGDDFVRGYGELNADGTKFTNLSTIIYDMSPLGVFKNTPCTS